MLLPSSKSRCKKWLCQNAETSVAAEPFEWAGNAKIRADRLKIIKISSKKISENAETSVAVDPNASWRRRRFSVLVRFGWKSGLEDPVAKSYFVTVFLMNFATFLDSFGSAATDVSAFLLNKMILLMKF